MIARRPGDNKRPQRAAPDGERLYALVSEAIGEGALDAVRAAFRTREEEGARVSRTYYDTFDRRLARAESLLCRTRGAGDRALRWETLSGQLVRRLVTSAEPAFASDLPDGPFRAALEPVVDVRKLLPVARITGGAARVSVLGKGGKTTLRLALESWSVAGVGRRGGQPRRAILRLAPVRGYAKVAREVTALLEGELGLLPLPATAVAEMLDLTARPADPAAAWPPPIEADMRSDEAARVIYRGLLATMRANEAGTRARTDPEFLHEYRVALRRTRAGLSRLKGVFPQRTVDRFKRDFAWLGRMTGPVRDIDVQLLEVPAYESSLPEEAHVHLEPLQAWLVREGERVQRALVKTLDSARYAHLLAAWGGFLERPLPTRTTLADAARPADEVARERIWKLHTRILSRGLAIDDATPAVRVHDLRLEAKKLRYLLEFFRRIFPDKEIKGQIAALKKLQEVLGRFNDFEVQQHALTHAAAAMGRAEQIPLDTILVMGRLVETLRGQQDAARAEIASRVAAYAEPENLARAEQLFSPRTQEQQA